MDYKITNAPKLPIQILQINKGSINTKTEYVDPVIQAPSIEDAKAYLQNKYMNENYFGELNSPDEWIVTEIKN